LRESEEKFRKITESAQDAIIIMGADQRISAWNLAAERLFGYTATEAIGQELHPLIAPRETQQAFKQGFVHFLQTGTGPVIGKVTELIALRKGGEGFPVEGSLAALSIRGQWNAIGIFRDITERKRAEEALRVSEERLHLATAAGNIGVWDWDVVKNVLTWDESMYVLYGIRKEDFGGAYDAWIGTLHPDDRKFTDGEIQAALRGEREYAPEFRIVRPDGTVRIIKAASKTYHDPQGNPIRMVGINIDISERKKAEEVTQAASQYSRSLIEASLDPLVTISAEGKITDVNTATERVTGVDRVSLIGSDFANYFTDPEKARKGYQQVFSQGFVTDYPLAIHHVSGKVSDVLYNASVYRDEADEVLGVFAAARDVTERNKAEQEVAQLSLQNRTILDSAGEGIYGLDTDGRCQASPKVR
jgi:PAS domain S-box-containing protein